MPLSVDRTARNDGRAVAETTRSGMAHAAWAERTRGLRTLLATVRTAIVPNHRVATRTKKKGNLRIKLENQT